MMAQKVTVALEDDLTGGPADETVRFADLSAKIAATFRKLLPSELARAGALALALPVPRSLLFSAHGRTCAAGHSSPGRRQSGAWWMAWPGSAGPGAAPRESVVWLVPGRGRLADESWPCRWSTV
jgi:hypothetical protein